MENNMSNSGNVEEVSLLDLDHKIEDMKKFRSALKREIDQNQLLAINLRESIKALQNKQIQLSNEMHQLDSTLLKRREEISNIDNLIDKERKIIEADKRDLIVLRDTINGEQLVFNSEKRGAMEAIEETRKKLTRLEVTLLNREADLKIHEQEVSGQLQELSDRRIKVKEDEIKLSARLKEQEVLKSQIETNLRSSEKALDEAKAKGVSYDSLLIDVRKREEKFRDIENHIKTCYEEIESKNLKLNDRERDVIIEEDMIKTMKINLLKEIEKARIDEAARKRMSDELKKGVSQ